MSKFVTIDTGYNDHNSNEFVKDGKAVIVIDLIGAVVERNGDYEIMIAHGPSVYTNKEGQIKVLKAINNRR